MITPEESSSSIEGVLEGFPSEKAQRLMMRDLTTPGAGCDKNEGRGSVRRFVPKPVELKPNGKSNLA